MSADNEICRMDAATVAAKVRDKQLSAAEVTEAVLRRETAHRDVQWVTGYRTSSSGPSFQPHITLGHAVRPPAIEPFDFEATTVAACHLGRFCSCRRVLRTYDLVP